MKEDFLSIHAKWNPIGNRFSWPFVISSEIIGEDSKVGGDDRLWSYKMSRILPSIEFSDRVVHFPLL